MEGELNNNENDSRRRKSLDHHSSNKVSTVSNGTTNNINDYDTDISSGQSGKSEKPFTSFMSSFFSKPAESSSSFSWLASSLRSEKVVSENLYLENLNKITSPSEAIASLRYALELKSDEYFHASLDLITHLCEQDISKNVASELGSLGACALIDQILGLKMASSHSCECCLRAMCSLITQPVAAVNDSGSTTTHMLGISQNVRKLSSSHTIYRVVKAAYTHMDDVIVLEWGLRVVNFVALEDGLLPKLLACGGCDLLARSLQRHKHCDEVLVWVCRNIHAFITQDRDGGGSTQDKLRDGGVCESLVTGTLAQHWERVSQVAAVWILKAVGSLARYHDANKRRFSAAGIFLLLPKLCKRFSLEDRTFCESVCWAIGNLAYPDEDNQTALGATGADGDDSEHSACAVVNRALRLHIQSAIVVQEGLRAVRSLAHEHDGNLAALHALGVVDTVVAVLDAHREINSEVMQWVWYAVATLADHDDCLADLGRLGMCSAVVASLGRFWDQEDLVQWAALALAKIARSPDLAAQLGMCNGCQAVTEALQTHLDNADVAEELLNAIGALCMGDRGNRVIFGNSRVTGAHSGGVCDLIVRALVRHEKADTVIEVGLFAAMSLVEADESGDEAAALTVSTEKSDGFVADSSAAKRPAQLTSGQQKASRERLVDSLLAAQACKVIPRALSKHSAESESVAEYGCRVLCDLVLSAGAAESESALLPSMASLHSAHRLIGDAESDTLSKLGQGGAAAALCAVLQAHMANSAIVRYALLALDGLCRHRKNIALLRSAGACALVVRTIHSHYQRSEHIVTAAYALVTHMCYDDFCRDEIGQSGGGEVVLLSLAHHLHSPVAAQLGCEAMSALCLCPSQDAVASLIYKENENTTSLSAVGKPGGAAPSSSSSAADWISFDASNVEHLNILALGDNAPTSPSKAASAHRKTGDTFFLNYNTLRGGAASVVGSGFESLSDAASNFISAGMSDKEEAAIMARQQSKLAKRANNERLHQSGANAMLITLVQTHAADELVLLAVCNAVNSLAMYPLNRAQIGRDGLLELLVAVFARCIGHGESVHAIGSAAEESVAGSRRLLTAMLCVMIGSLCLPDQSRDQGDSGRANKALVSAPQGAAARQLPFANQEHLGALKVGEQLVHCAGQARTDPLRLEVAFRALYYLALGHEGNQVQLGAAESSALVVQMLREHIDKPKIVYYTSLCISALAQGNRSNCALLAEHNVCEAVVAALSRYVADEDVAEACCHAIYALKPLNSMLGTAGACEFVLQTLTQHPANATVAQWVCRAIGTLAEFESNKEELDKHGVCKTVTAALQKHVSSDSILSAALFMRDTSSAGVAQWGCTAIYYIAKGFKSEEYQAKLVAAGACEAVAKALVKFSEVESVSYCCCRTLVVLLMGNEPYKAKLGAMGVCACIVESMHLFPSSVNIAKWGCRAAAVLVESNEANIARIGMAGGCETIPVIIQAHQNSEHVAGAGCDVIAFMAEQLGTGASGSGANYAARLGRAGGCEAVISVLRKHNANASVVSRASIALAALAKDKGNSAWLGPAGASDALYAALDFHQRDVSVCKFVVSAMGNLCIIENNKGRLGSIGSCELVVRVFRAHIADLDTAKAAGLAVGKLCELITRQQDAAERDGGAVRSSTGTSGGETTAYQRTRRETGSSSSNGNSPVHFESEGQQATCEDSTPISTHHRSRPNRAALFESGVCEVVVEALRHHLPSASAANILCRSISVIAFGNACASERLAFGSLGACKEVTAAIQFHEGNEEVARCGCLAVKALAHNSPANKQTLEECGISRLVIMILRGYRYAASGPAVVEAAAWAVSNLATNSVANKISLGAAGACEGLLEVMELHSRNPETTYLTLKALFHVCDGNAANRLKISFSGAADILSNVLSRYPDDERVVEFVFSTMIGMCLDKVGQSRLGTVGAAKLAVGALYRFEKSSEYLCMIGCSFVAALAASSPANQAKLASAGACKAVTSAMVRYMHSTSGASFVKVATTSPTAATAAPAAFGTEGNSSNSSLSRGGSYASVSAEAEREYASTALSALIDEFSVLKEGCKAVVQLSANNEANRTRLVATGILDTLATVLSSSFASSGSNGLPPAPPTMSGSGQHLSKDGAVVPALIVSEDTREWAKLAMDALIGKTYA